MGERRILGRLVSVDEISTDAEGRGLKVKTRKISIEELLQLGTRKNENESEMGGRRILGRFVKVDEISTDAEGRGPKVKTRKISIEELLGTRFAAPRDARSVPTEQKLETVEQKLETLVQSLTTSGMVLGNIQANMIRTDELMQTNMTTMEERFNAIERRLDALIQR